MSDRTRRRSSTLRQVIRGAVVATGLFTSSTAIGGGIALATGLEGERFPAEWLERTTFHDYRIPGLILGVVVGGSAATATAATLARSRFAAPASIAAGLVLTGWILGEIRLLEQPGRPTTLEVVYLVDGLTMAVLGLLLSRTERPRRTGA